MPWTHRDFWLFPLYIAAILGTLAFLISHSKLWALYQKYLAQTRRERVFLAAVGFFTTVLVIRAVTIAIHLDIGPFHDVSMRGLHVHHLVWGILLLLLVGYGWLSEFGTGSDSSARWLGRCMSMLYGVAAALTLDEFALWLNLKDVYWERQGRESFEAMGLFGALLLIGISGGPFFRGMSRLIVGVFRRDSTPPDKL
jgi:hypothetical protein